MFRVLVVFRAGSYGGAALESQVVEYNSAEAAVHAMDTILEQGSAHFSIDVFDLDDARKAK